MRSAWPRYGMFTCFGLLIGYGAGCRPPDPKPVADMPRPETVRSVTMGKGEFEAAVRGKDRAGVTALVGPPDQVCRDVPGGGQDANVAERLYATFDWWAYRNLVVDPATGRPHGATAIRFGPGGTVDRIDYAR